MYDIDCNIIVNMMHIIAYIIFHIIGNIITYDIICLDYDMILRIIVYIIYDIINMI
jgi:hypothetical protein